MTKTSHVDRRNFLTAGAAATAAAGLSLSARESSADDEPVGEKTRVGVIGCGRVSRIYLPDLLKSNQIEIVSTCDIVPERAEQRAGDHGVPNHYPHIDEMLDGPEFDLLVNLTDMQEHYHLNKQALEAGLNVWSEKPMGTTYAQTTELLELAEKQGVLMYGAPTVVSSPQYAYMNSVLRDNRLGPIAAAHATYGHYGPSWSSFFYDEDGGSMFDLGVYQITSLTGLLGPAKAVVGMTTIVTPTRQIPGKGEIDVVAEDNTMMILDHGDGALSHIQCGFSYFSAHLHSSTTQHAHTMTVIGKDGLMELAGYDWAPKGVELLTRADGRLDLQATDTGDYVWEWGARKFAEHLGGGPKPLFAPQHAAHVVDIIECVKLSQKEGRRVEVDSTFDWPVAT